MNPTIECTARLKDKRNGRECTYTYQCEQKYADDQEFLWTEGNYACDCNRSLLMYGEGHEMECGCESEVIELVSLTISDKPVIVPVEE